MKLLWRFVTAFLVVKLVVQLINLPGFPVLGRGRQSPVASRQRVGRRVSILVPGRDEAHNRPRTLPGLLDQGAAEVLVLDDASTDGTAEVARSVY